MNQKLYLAILFLLCSTGVMAQPANDNVADAILLPVDGSSALFNNTDATVETGEPVPPAGDCEGKMSWCDQAAVLENSVWFSFVAPADGRVNINSCFAATALDQQIAVWRTATPGDFGTFVLVGANDDNPNFCEDDATGGVSSFLQLCHLTAGETYYLQVDGYDGDQNDFEISLSNTGVCLPEMTNDQPCNAIALATDGVPVMYTNEGAEIDEDEVSPPNTGENCDSDWCDEELNNTIWFSFVAPASGSVTITTCTEDNEVDTQIAVWDVDDCLNYSTYALLGANDDVLDGCSSGSSDYASELTVCGLVAGTTYLIQVDAYGGEEGTVSIGVTANADCNITANLQVINNSADAALATVDVRLNGTLVADNLNYGQATVMVPVIGLTTGILTINAANSADSSNSIFHQAINFTNGANHIAVINGIHSTSGYNTSVNDVAVGLEFFPFPENTENNEVLVVAVNGVTDAAPVTFQFGDEVIFTGLSYGEITGGPLSGSGHSTFFNADSTVTYGAFAADLTPYLGQSVVVLLTGFADPEANSNGPFYGMCVVTSAGGTFNCMNNLILGIGEESLAGAVAIYPNPVSDICTIDFETLAQKEVEIQVYDLPGNLVKNVRAGQTGAGKQSVELNMQGLASGMYMVNIQLNGQTAARQKLQLIR